ncbi:MAG: class I SAM-dependent methyltransferase [Gaiellaceae bacterium]
METALVELLRCSCCRAVVRPAGGGLLCDGCGRSFVRAPNGIPLMLHRDLPGAAEKLAEASGWVEKARQEGWYEPDDEVDAALPFVRELGWSDLNWLANGHSFQVLLGRYLEGARGLRVLEVGAGKAWAARFWRELDSEFVATDILVDDRIGLGRGAFYGDFGRVQADGENLPFADETFDVTYCVATLHHALDLRRMVGEMARVTRHGGVVAGLNEGARGVFRNAANPEQAGEKALGINEHVHTPWAYAAAFARAGIAIRRVERSDGWSPRVLGRTLAHVPKLGTTLTTLLHASAAGYVGISIYGRKR